MGTITATGLGKAYKQYPSPWFRLAEWLLPRSVPRHRLHWVLQGIDLTIAPGETVGLIGINGAGKSTLLKILAGTTRPTTGSLHMTGRVAALLELGMGFHPDFSGRQKVYMAGQLMGLSASDIQSLMPAIEAFAEIGEYIDQPVRVYSSGMQMRLAFSIATAARPAILIVDEALSVGDAYFQHKSFNKIREFREQGTTLLIVSHDRGGIQSLCDRAILLERGFVIKDGPPEEVMDFYNALIAERENATVQVKRLDDGRTQTTSGTGEARVESIELRNEKGEVAEYVNVGEAVRLQVHIRLHADLPELVFGYMIKDRLGQPVFGTNTHHLKVPMEQLKQGELLTLAFSFPAHIGVGSYSVSTALHVAETHLAANYEWRDQALMFNVVNVNRDTFVGVNWLPPQVEYTK